MLKLTAANADSSRDASSHPRGLPPRRRDVRSRAYSRRYRTHVYIAFDVMDHSAEGLYNMILYNHIIGILFRYDSTP